MDRPLPFEVWRDIGRVQKEMVAKIDRRLINDLLTPDAHEIGSEEMYCQAEYIAYRLRKAISYGEISVVTTRQGTMKPWAAVDLLTSKMEAYKHG